MRLRTEQEIKSDIARKKMLRQSTAALLVELQQAVVRRLKSEVKAKRRQEREARWPEVRINL